MVARLSRQQIRIIKEKIGKEGVSTAELAEDLLDHLCTCVEEEMERGLSFETAFEKVFNSLEEDELKLTEMKTQELLEGKKVFYPNLSQSFGLVVLFILGRLIILGLKTKIGVDNPDFVAQFIKTGYYPLFVIIINLIVFGGVIGYAIREIRKTQWKVPIFSFRPVPLHVYPIVACIALLNKVWMEPLMMFGFVSREEMIKGYESLQPHSLGVVLLVASFNFILAELLFRGIILKGLLKTSASVKAILWSSLFFAAANFIVPLSTFVLGLMLGWIYWKTKSLYPTIFMVVFGTAVGYCTLFYMGNWGELFTWREYFDNLWLYIGAVAVSFLLTLGLLYYLHRKLSGNNQP